MLTPNLLFLQVFAILLATQERPSAFEADPGGELAKLSVPVGEDGMNLNETETDGVYFTEGRCCGSWVGSLQVHQLGEVDSANLAEWKAVFWTLWASRGWFLTEETAGGDGRHSGDDAGAEAMSVAEEAEAPASSATEEHVADKRGPSCRDGGGVKHPDSNVYGRPVEGTPRTAAEEHEADKRRSGRHES